MGLRIVGGMIALSAGLACAGCGGSGGGNLADLNIDVPQREILIDNVKTARADEEAAKQQFQTTLQQLQAITHFDGGDLELEYNKFNYQYEACQGSAKAVDLQLAKVDASASALFSDWAAKLKNLGKSDARGHGEAELTDSKVRYQKLNAAMKSAAAKMPPVLKKFDAQAVYIKQHVEDSSLHSVAPAASGIDEDLTALIRELQAAITDADTFIERMTPAE